YKWKPKSGKENVNSNVSMPLGNASRTVNVMDTMTSRRSIVSNIPLPSNSFAAHRDCPIHRRLWHRTRNLKLLINFMEKFLGTVKFGNDQIATILGYRDLVQGVVTIKRVYYVKGLNHNLFLVGQFCDADLEVAFRKSTCYIRDLKGNDLLTDFVFVIGKMQASLQGKDNAIRQLKKQLSELQATCRDTECTIKVQTTDSQLTKVTDPVTNLQAQNDRFRAENDKVKQHYKQLYDSIKITRAKHIEQLTKLIAKNVTLKTSVSKAKVQPSVLTQTKHAGDVELIVPRLRNNRDAHLDYLRHLKESVETIRDIVEEAKVEQNVAPKLADHSLREITRPIGSRPLKVTTSCLSKTCLGRTSLTLEARIVLIPIVALSAL
nr:integrase, catalytic region, zinc finger, CCHC-type, peptidase aspartic, catalytic [Tanacetum cinerariifolium]